MQSPLKTNRNRQTSASTLASSKLQRETPRSSVNTEEMKDIVASARRLKEGTVCQKEKDPEKWDFNVITV